MNKFANIKAEVNLSLLDDDEYTFSVLARILTNPCTLTISDDKRFIICFSCAPFPVWVWTADDMTDAEYEELFLLIDNELPFDHGYTYNLKYGFAEFIMQKRSDIKKTMDMFAYMCPKLMEPSCKADGAGRRALMEDEDMLTDFVEGFRNTIGIDRLANKEAYRKETIRMIREKRLYVWENSDKEPVAIASYGLNKDDGSVGNVYTLPQKRRRGYAMNLVHMVTKEIIAIGKRPVLYTDASNPASNDCYKKIGFQLQGKLCTISKK